MSKMQIFENAEFGQIRTVVIEGEPWFVGKDIATALGYSNVRDAIMKHVDKEDKGVAKCDTLGGTQEMTIINESGLYSLVLSSKLGSAKRFKRWVTSEVLPQIRKTGTYRLKPMTTAEQIKILAQGSLELEQKIDSVNKDLQEFKQEMPLLAVECDRIVQAKNQKVVPLLGGKNSNAYHNASLRSKIYRDLEGQLRREFGVTSYKAIRRNQTDKAVELIRNYELPLCLAEQVSNENAQMQF